MHDQTVGELQVNDAGLEKVKWRETEATDVEVERLAAALKGNTVCRTVDLIDNPGVTDASMRNLRAAVGQSGVVRVNLQGTHVGETEQVAMKEACLLNLRRDNQDKWEADLRQLAAGDLRLESVNWTDSGATDAEVDRLATALKGNTACQTVWLDENPGVTDASMRNLRAAVGQSGVVKVNLWRTNVGEEEQKKMKGLLAGKSDQAAEEPVVVPELAEGIPPVREGLFCPTCGADFHDVDALLAHDLTHATPAVTTKDLFGTYQPAKSSWLFGEKKGHPAKSAGLFGEKKGQPAKSAGPVYQCVDCSTPEHGPLTFDTLLDQTRHFNTVTHHKHSVRQYAPGSALSKIHGVGGARDSQYGEATVPMARAREVYTSTAGVMSGEKPYDYGRWKRRERRPGELGSIPFTWTSSGDKTPPPPTQTPGEAEAASIVKRNNPFEYPGAE
jgi:RNA-binding protein YhbY